VEKAEVLYVYPAMGKTIDAVRCPCGRLNHFYVWSWAGHGRARCKGCERWIDHSTLKVRDVEDKDAAKDGAR